MEGQATRMKFCPCCQEVRRIEEFYKSRNSADGHQGYCRACQCSRPWGAKTPNAISEEELMNDDGINLTARRA